MIKNRPDISREQVDYTKAMMLRAVPDGIVDSFESIVSSLQLPDPDDRHVLAAAIRAGAEVIITLNLKDFPRRALAPYAIEAHAPDDFILRMSDINADSVFAAARACRRRLVAPTMSAMQYCEVLTRHGLTNTAQFLRKDIERI